MKEQGVKNALIDSGLQQKAKILDELEQDLLIFITNIQDFLSKFFIFFQGSLIGKPRPTLTNAQACR